jgi:deoxycytidylate deaminase
MTDFLRTTQTPYLAFTQCSVHALPFELLEALRDRCEGRRAIVADLDALLPAHRIGGVAGGPDLRTTLNSTIVMAAKPCDDCVGVIIAALERVHHLSKSWT